MRPKSLILLSLALGCGLVASLGINQVMSKGSPVAQAPTEKITVFVAKKEINLNDLITGDMLTTKDFSKEDVNKTAILDLKNLKGRRARQRISVDEVILESKLLPKGENARASEHIPIGLRTVAIRVNAASTGGFLIKQGDHVDLMVYLRKNNSLDIKHTMIRTFMQNIKVFAVDNVLTQNVDGKNKTSTKTISVLVTFDQAEILTMAANLGTVTLVLRSPEDEQIVESSRPKSLWDIIAGGQSEQPPESRAESKTVAETAPLTSESVDKVPVETQSGRGSWWDVLSDISKDMKPVERRPRMDIFDGKGEVTSWEFVEGSLLPRRISQDTNAGDSAAPAGFASPYALPQTGRQGKSSS